MPIAIAPLSEKAVQALTRRKPGQYAVGGVPGLYLSVVPPNSSSWVLRYNHAGTRKAMGLGPYPEVGLAKAREAATEKRDLVRKGIDPLASKRNAVQIEKAVQKEREAAAVTFRMAAEATIERRANMWKSKDGGEASSVGDWQGSLERHVYPVIGDLPCSAIDNDAVLKVLEPIWYDKSETAKKIRERMEIILAYATHHGYRQGANPAAMKGNLEHVLYSNAKKVQSHRSLPYTDAPATWSQLATKREGLKENRRMGVTAAMLNMLCANRAAEIMEMRWGYVDLDRGVWTVPALEMKGTELHGRDHVIPMSQQAADLLKLYRDERIAGGYHLTGEHFVFPGKQGNSMMSNGTMNKVFNDAGIDTTPHGLRATFKTWSREQLVKIPGVLAAIPKYDDKQSEMALGHKVGDSTYLAYMRSDMLEARRIMMQDYANFVTGKTMPPIGALAAAQATQAA